MRKYVRVPFPVVTGWPVVTPARLEMVPKVFHDLLLKRMYRQTASVWRPVGVEQGFRFGILLAFLQVPLSALIWYSVLPIPAALAVSWMAAGLVLNTVLGLVAGLVYKP